MKYIVYIATITLFLPCAGIYSQDLIENTKTGKVYKSQQTLSEIPRLRSDLDKKTKNNNIRTVDIFSFCSDEPASAVDNKVSRAIELNYIESGSKIVKNLQDSDLIRIPIPVSPTKSFNLLLYPMAIHAENYTVMTGDGIWLNDDHSISQTLSYRGIVENDPHSIAAAVYDGKDWVILVSDDLGNYNIGRSAVNDETYVLYNDRNMREIKTFECHTDQLEPNQNYHMEWEPKNLKSAPTPQCLNLYIECDHNMYVRHGSSIAKVENYIANLISATNAVYANLSIDVRVQTLVIWTTQDPYISANSTSAMLTQFGARIQNNFNGVLAHLLSTRNLGGGIAWLDVLCNSYNSQQSSGPYAVSAALNTSFASLPTYSWDVAVFAHEMGHNLGSPHTHSCSWPGGAIDNCAPTEGSCAPGPKPFAGTVMSYCHQCTPNACGGGCNTCTNPGISLSSWGALPGQRIQSRVLNASCDPSCNCSKHAFLGKALLNGTHRAKELIRNLGNNNLVTSTTILRAPVVELNGILTVRANAVLEIQTAACKD